MIRKYRYVYKGDKSGLDLNDPKIAKLIKTQKYLTDPTIKSRAFELRQSGKTYGEIVKELGLAKSTISYWFNDSVDNETKESNRLKNIEASKIRLLEFRKNKNRELLLSYDNAIKEAGDQFEKYKSEPLFVAGLMLYAGEGDKTTRCHIRISNSNWKLHEIFIKFLAKYLDFKREKVALQILCYPDNNIEEVKEYWSNNLKIFKGRFHKVQIIKGKSKKRLQYGVGMTIINNTRAKYKLLEWINLLENNF